MENKALAQVEEAYVAMDCLDDQQIVAELQGRIFSQVAEKLFYSFPVGGKVVEGLSKRGVSECIRWMCDFQGIFVSEDEATWCKDLIDDDFVLFTARVTRVSSSGKFSVMGTKRQCVKIRKKNGEFIPDPFWFEKGCTKAFRNAKLSVIPASVHEAFLLDVKEKKKAYARNAKAPEKRATESQRMEFLALCKRKRVEPECVAYDYNINLEKINFYSAELLIRNVKKYPDFEPDPCELIPRADAIDVATCEEGLPKLFIRKYFPELGMEDGITLKFLATHEKKCCSYKKGEEIYPCRPRAILHRMSSWRNEAIASLAKKVLELYPSEKNKADKTVKGSKKDG